MKNFQYFCSRKLLNSRIIHIHENKFFGELKDDFLDMGLEEFYFYRNYLEYSDRIANRCDGKYWKGRTEKESPMRVIKL